MKFRIKKAWFVAALIFFMVCVVMDFIPIYGPPHFRYTGSDPALHVWNLGWPFATSIYDPRTGFHVGPFAYVVIPFQIFAFTAAFVVIEVIPVLWKYWRANFRGGSLNPK